MTSLMSVDNKPTLSSRRCQRLKLGVTFEMEEGGLLYWGDRGTHHSKWPLTVHGLTMNEGLEIWILSFGMVSATSTASPRERRWSYRLKWEKMMALDNFGHMATLKLMAQRPTIHYTSVKLAVGETVWLTTMECNFLLQTGTMMSGPLTVQAPMEAVDGGTSAAMVPSWPAVTVQGGYFGMDIKYTLRWDSAQRAAKQWRPATKTHSGTTKLW